MEWLTSAEGLNARQELEASVREHHPNLRDVEIDLIVDGRLLRMVRERAAEQAPASGQQGGTSEGGAGHEAPTAVGVGGGAVAPTIDTGMSGTSYSQFKFGVEHISTLSIEQSYKQITSDASAVSGAVNTIVATTGVNGKEGKGGKEQTDKKKDGKREKKQGPFKRRCYNCNEEGHMAAKCPNKKKDATPAAAANVAEGDGNGVALTVECSAAKLLVNDKDMWFLDSGCSQHMSGRKEWFTVIRDPSATKSVKGFDGSMQEVAARNGATAAAACNGTAAAAACNDMAAGAASNGIGAASACNGTAKEIADVASSKLEANDGAASLKTYAVGSKAMPNLWHARLGHVHFDAVKRTATSGGVFGMDLEKGVPSVQGGEQPLDRSVGPLGSKAPTAPPPLGPPSIADSAPVGPEDGSLEGGGDTTDFEEEGEVAVDEQPPVAHAHEPSLAAPPIQPIPQPPRRSSRPNKGVPPVRFQPSALTAQDVDEEENPYDMAYLA
ncbi:unnamed protein product [Closterium sp. Yama58-4]|nr:unnamed protein product [Closterium sp. Yama58-4]